MAKQKQMKKDQRSLAKILDALDGFDRSDIRKLLRAAAIFHDVPITEVTTHVIRERPWTYWLNTPLWTSCGSSGLMSGSNTLEMPFDGNRSGGQFTTSDARYEVTNCLLEASSETVTDLE